MRYIYVLLVLMLFLSGCYLGKEWLKPQMTQMNTDEITSPFPLGRDGRTMTKEGMTLFSAWWEFVGSVVSLAAGTYLATRKIRLLLNNGLNGRTAPQRRKGTS
jgi:hypothetical protein